MPPSRTDLHNLLLRRMPAADLALLTPHLRPFTARRGDVVFDAGGAVRDVIFLDTGMISLVAESPEGQRVEAGLFGREGFGPTNLAAGDDLSVYEGNVQLPGAGRLIAAEPFRAALAASASLRTLLLRFAHTLAVQSGYTALSNAVHPVEERLARWVLMCDDRAGGGELALTHDFLSVMLAVRRPTITTALHVLEGNGFIRSERARVTVRDRAALEEFARDAYGKPEAEYRRLLGPFP